MKRLNNLYEKIYCIENLQLADKRARKGKGKTYGVTRHDKNKDSNISQLHIMLKEKTYQTSPYSIFAIHEPKERLIYRLPYFPDRICHHAVMNIMEPVWTELLIAQSYSCIKGRGIHAAMKDVKKALKDIEGTKYCLKLDIKKFYDSIDHDVLKTILRRKIKDPDLLWLLDEIIGTAPGVPIGNYLSQFFANIYLAYFDHWIKENKAVKYYFRYADDIVILHHDKEYLHNLFKEIESYIKTNLKLKIKENWQVFPVAARSLDFVGYRFYHTHILLRKSIKQNLCRAAKRKNNQLTMAAYYGWAKHCNSKNLLNKILNEKSCQNF